MVDNALSKFKNVKTSKDRKRVGRGSAAGGGKTAGRGTKGQKARTGGNVPAYFEGGQKTLLQRLPKNRGFKSPARFKTQIINLVDLHKWLNDDKTLTIEGLRAKHFLKGTDRVKLLGEGKLSGEVTSVETNFISVSAKKALEDAKVEIKIVF
jgi:large subunit ribosomal protein L15